MFKIATGWIMLTFSVSRAAAKWKLSDNVSDNLRLKSRDCRCGHRRAAIGWSILIIALMSIFTADGFAKDINEQAKEILMPYCQNHAVHSLRALIAPKESRDLVQVAEMIKYTDQNSQVHCVISVIGADGSHEVIAKESSSKSDQQFLSFSDFSEDISRNLNFITSGEAGCGTGGCGCRIISSRNLKRRPVSGGRCGWCSEDCTN